MLPFSLDKCFTFYQSMGNERKESMETKRVYRIGW